MDLFSLKQLYTAGEALLRMAYSAVILFVLWKFYHLLARINGNIAGIKDVLERTERNRFGGA